MKALNRAIDKFCLKHRNFGIPRLMLYIVGINAAVYVISQMDRTGMFLWYLVFDPASVLRGEVWRLITWVFIPDGGSIVMVALSLYFYYFIGSTLEQVWRTPKFTVYYIIGVLLNIIYGFLAYLVFKMPVLIVPSYLNLSMFFAFAVLFPDQQVRLFFIIPIKIKWLALVDAVFFIYFIVSDIAAGNYLSAFLPVVAIFNFFIFCGHDLMLYLRPVRARSSRQVIEFKRAAKQAKRELDKQPYRHKCAVCGKTDVENPGLEFRYCSRCEGYHCFCIDHINSHVHFQ